MTLKRQHQGITGVFQLWYETKRHPYNWNTLLMILRSPVVNELDDIEENYQGITGVF